MKGKEAAMKHILERLPGDETKLGAIRKELSGTLFGDRAKAHTGEDHARASAVGYLYLNGKCVLKCNAYEKFKAKRLKVSLPSITCSICQGVVPSSRYLNENLKVKAGRGGTGTIQIKWISTHIILDISTHSFSNFETSIWIE